MAEVAEIRQGANRPGLAWHIAAAWSLGGWRDGKFELVIAHGAPSIEPLGTQFGGKLPGKAMHREYPPRPHTPHAFHQPRVVRMVGKRNDFIDPVTVLRCRLQRPTGKHGTAFA